MSELKTLLDNTRTTFRLSRMGLHLLWAMVTVGCLYPLAPIRVRRMLKARWSRQLLEVLGVQLAFSGTPPSSGLIVSNHISWLDIFAINALVPTSFVAKDDVRHWPLFGWLSGKTETIFLERGSRTAAMRAKARLVDALRRQTCVGVFPEGTTSDGDKVLPFHSALFQSVLDAGTCVIPVALCYRGRDGEATTTPAYIGETTILQSLIAIAGADHLTAHLTFLPPLDPAGMDRRRLAEHAHQIVAHHLARPAARRAN